MSSADSDFTKVVPALTLDPGSKSMILLPQDYLNIKGEDKQSTLLSVQCNSTCMNAEVDEIHHNLLQELAEAREQVQALLTAISLASRLASMDAMKFHHKSYIVAQQRKIENLSADDSRDIKESAADDSGNQTPMVTNQSFTDYDTHHRNEADSPDMVTDGHDVVKVEGQLKQLQQGWKLEETSLPSLVQSIHRLQSNIVNLQIDAENNSHEIHTLHNIVICSKSRIKKLERVVRKLYQDNKEIKDQFAEKKRQWKSFARDVKHYVTQKREEELKKEDLLAASRLTLYERMMKWKHLQARNSTSVDSPMPESSINNHLCYAPTQSASVDHDTDLHSLTSSIDNFDSLRSYDWDLNAQDAEDMSLRSSDLERIIGADLVPNDPTFSYPRDRTISLDSLASNRSLVTDECPATIRYESFNFHDSAGVPEIGSVSEDTYSLYFHDRKHIGLQFKLVPLTLQDDGTQQPMLHGIMVEEGSVIHHNICDSPYTETASDNNSVKKSMVTKLDDFFTKAVKNSKNKGPKGPETNLEPDVVCLVSGFEGFDATKNIKPRLGARLVAIGDESLLTNKKLTLEMIWKIMESVESNAPQNNIILTFRNDPLSKFHRDLLQGPLVENMDRADAMNDDGNGQTVDQAAQRQAPIVETDKPKILKKIFNSFGRDSKDKDQSIEVDDSSNARPRFMPDSGISFFQKKRM